MKEVFISYSTIDSAQAEMIRGILEKNGFSCWMAPKDIPGGSNYTREIPVAIRNCKVFLLILSTHSQNSPWVLKELDAAVNNAKVILPLMLESFDLNDEFNFLLSGTQRYTAYQKNTETIKELINRIRVIVGVRDADLNDRPKEQAVAEDANESASHPEAIPEMNHTTVDGNTPRCPVCHSQETIPQPRKFKVDEPAEWVYKVIPFLMSLLCSFVGLMVLAFMDASAAVAFFGLVAFIIIGVIWGRSIALVKVNQHRLSKNRKVECFKCNRCKKVFNHSTNLE